MNTYTVRLFAAAADRMMCGCVEVPLPVGSTVAGLRHLFTCSSPSLLGIIERCAIAVNHDYAPDDQVLNPGDEIAVIPPVSGG